MAVVDQPRVDFVPNGLAHLSVVFGMPVNADADIEFELLGSLGSGEETFDHTLFDLGFVSIEEKLEVFLNGDGDTNRLNHTLCSCCLGCTM